MPLKTNGPDLIALLEDLLIYQYDYKSQDTSYEIISTINDIHPIVTAYFKAVNNDAAEEITGTIKYMLEDGSDDYMWYENAGYPYMLRFINVSDSRAPKPGNHVRPSLNPWGKPLLPFYKDEPFIKEVQ